MRKMLASLLLASSLVGCATQVKEDVELPEVITEGAADSWAHPTEFGKLFQGVWQFGTLDPSSNQNFPAFTFELTADADVSVVTRQAPTDEPELTSSVLYVYKQRDEGTWQRIARTEPTDDFARLSKNLGAGVYRVIVKGVEQEATGQFMVQLRCDGAGCVDPAEQCILGSTFHENVDVKEGALVDYGSKVLTATSQMNDALKAQIIAAVRESAHDDVTTIEAAFEAVDQGEINRYRFYDNLAGRSLIAIEYGAGDNSYGAVFVEDGTEVAASINDGDIYECKLQPRACVFGQSMGEAAFMPDMKQTSDVELTDAAGLSEMLQKQIVAATGSTTVSEAFESVDEGIIYVETFRHQDAREFTVVRYYGGDNPVGAYFRSDSDVIVASIGDGEIGGCTEF